MFLEINRNSTFTKFLNRRYFVVEDWKLLNWATRRGLALSVFRHFLVYSKFIRYYTSEYQNNSLYTHSSDSTSGYGRSGNNYLLVGAINNFVSKFVNQYNFLLACIKIGVNNPVCLKRKRYTSTLRTVSKYAMRCFCVGY